MAAAIAFLPRQGASTRLAIGSQIIPRLDCKAMEAAATACSRLPPARVTRPAADIPDAEPHSAWQPPISAENVAPRAMKTPIIPAASRAFTAASSSSPRNSAAARQVPGKTPHEPAVGAATTRPMELLHSMVAVTARRMAFRTPASSSRPCSINSLYLPDCQPRMRSSYSVPASPASMARRITPAI